MMSRDKAAILVRKETSSRDEADILLLRSKNRDSQNFAIDRLDEMHYPDDEVRVALLTALEELHR
jgi:hypothetical protein